jgi:hypothetical protein
VTGVHNQGGLVRVDLSAADGSTFEVDLPRVSRPTGLGVGAQLKLRPRRVFVFADAPVP